MTNTIILTGAICPAFPVKRKNPYIRLLDYLCAIRRWLDVPALDQVIYCDASGSHIPEEVFSSEKFESLSFDASDLVRHHEAGRGEAETIQYVLDHSGKKFDSFYKCTGRLFVQNFGEIRNEFLRKAEQDVFLRAWQDEPWMKDWADTRFFWMKSDVYRQRICPRIPELKGRAYRGLVMESLFYDYYSPATSFSEPIFVGHSGHGNFVYHEEYSWNEMETAREIIARYGTNRFFNTKVCSSNRLVFR